MDANTSALAVAIERRITNSAMTELRAKAKVGQPTVHLYEQDKAIITAIAKELARLGMKLESMDEGSRPE